MSSFTTLYLKEPVKTFFLGRGKIALKEVLKNLLNIFQ
jgi:hypothetical protein